MSRFLPPIDKESRSYPHHPRDRDPRVREPRTRDPYARKPFTRESTLTESFAREPPPREPFTRERLPFTREPTLGEPIAKESQLRESYAREPPVREPYGREPQLRESQVQEPSLREPYEREAPTRESHGRDSHGREPRTSEPHQVRDARARDRSPLGIRKMRPEASFRDRRQHERFDVDDVRYRHPRSFPDRSRHFDAYDRRHRPKRPPKPERDWATLYDAPKTTTADSPQKGSRGLPFEDYDSKEEETETDGNPFTSDAIQFRSFKQTAKMFEKSLDELENQEEEEEEEVVAKQRMEFFCEVCNIHASSMHVLQAHFAGAKHQKELRKSGLSNDFSEIGKDKYVEEDPSLKTKILSCKLCDVVFSGSEMGLHVNNPAHLAALDDFEEPPAKDDPFWFVEVGQQTEVVKHNEPERTEGGFHCELCGCTLPHYELFQIHLNGKSHQKKVKWVEGEKEMPDGMKQHWCSVCNIFCTNREALANHLVGKKHAKTLRQRGVTEPEDGQQYQGPTPPSTSRPLSTSNSLRSNDMANSQSKLPSSLRSSDGANSHSNPPPASNQRTIVPLSIDKNERVRCKLCFVTLYSNKAVRSHMATQEHVRNVMLNPHLNLQDILIPD